MADGTVNKCKTCNRKDVRKNYVKNIDRYKEYERKRFQDPKRKAYVIKQARKHRQDNPDKARARVRLSSALRLGVIRKPETCEKCRLKAPIEAHHTDYTRPLFVAWLRRPCHRKEHGQLQYEI